MTASARYLAALVEGILVISVISLRAYGTLVEAYQGAWEHMR